MFDGSPTCSECGMLMTPTALATNAKIAAAHPAAARRNTQRDSAKGTVRRALFLRPGQAAIGEKHLIRNFGSCGIREIDLRGRATRASNKRIGPKKRKGLESEAPSSKTPFHPVPRSLGHHHPGEIKNHFATDGASVLPPIRNSYVRFKPLIQKCLGTQP